MSSQVGIKMGPRPGVFQPTPYIKVPLNKIFTHINFLGKKIIIMWPTLISKLEIWHEL